MASTAELIATPITTHPLNTKMRNKDARSSLFGKLPLTASRVISKGTMLTIRENMYKARAMAWALQIDLGHTMHTATKRVLATLSRQNDQVFTNKLSPPIDVDPGGLSVFRHI